MRIIVQQATLSGYTKIAVKVHTVKPVLRGHLWKEEMVTL
jgi:hypothetical protein